MEKAEYRDDLVARIQALKHFSGDAPIFWSRYMEAVQGITEARAVFLLRASESDETAWDVVLSSPRPGTETLPITTALANLLTGLARRASSEGDLIQEEVKNVTGCRWMVAKNLEVPGNRKVLAVALMDDGEPEEGEDLLFSLSLLADLAVRYQANRQTGSASTEALDVLDTCALAFDQKSFMASCMTLCNALAERYRCDQVCIGFLQNNQYVRLAAVSGTSRFDRKMDLVRHIEDMMEESADQERDVIWPVPEGDAVITREHDQFSREQGIPYLCTQSVRAHDQVAALIHAQRMDEPFDEASVRKIGLTGELLVHRLLELRQKDRFFLSRWTHAVREKASGFLGVENTWLKILGVVVAVVLLAMIFIRLPHRVEASFILKTDKMAFLSAPFDGFVETVKYEVGDEIKAGQTLIELDKKSLVLEKSAANADLQGYLREEEKSQAENDLAKMLINRAMAERARARMALIDYRLDQSSLRVPFDSVVVDGEWKDRLNAPVRQGDVLTKMARLDQIYLEVEIDQSDIPFVNETMDGEFAFISDPKNKFPMKLIRIQPVAVTKEKDLVVRARAEFEVDYETWWRPGMSGIAKINGQRRSLWWIVTHKTVDAIRRFLWW